MLKIVSVGIICHLFILTNSQCIGTNSCLQGNVHCGSTSDDLCDIECKGSGACNLATIECGTQETCSITCSYTQSCSSAYVYCAQTSNNPTCNINCTGAASCLSMTIVCYGSSESDCYPIVCSGQQACESVSVVLETLDTTTTTPVTSSNDGIKSTATTVTTTTVTTTTRTQSTTDIRSTAPVAGSSNSTVVDNYDGINSTTRNTAEGNSSSGGNGNGNENGNGNDTSDNRSDFGEFVSRLNEQTGTVALIIGLLAISVTFMSYLHSMKMTSNAINLKLILAKKSKSSKIDGEISNRINTQTKTYDISSVTTLNNYNYNNSNNTNNNNNNINNTNGKNEDNEYSIDDSYYSDPVNQNNNNGNTNGVGSDIIVIENSRQDTVFEIFRPPNVQHFVFIKVGITLFDFFSDIAFGLYLLYLILYSNNDSKYLTLFIIYTIFLFFTYMCNLMILVNLFKKEFDLGNKYKFNEFNKWFTKYATTSSGFRIVYIISMMNIELMSILYSRAFNYPLFFAPFCFDTIKYLKKSAILAVLFENIPQLITQIIVLGSVSSNNDNNDNNDNAIESFDWITVMALMVGIVEIIIVVVDVFVWNFAQPAQSQHFGEHGNTSGYVQLATY